MNSAGSNLSDGTPLRVSFAQAPSDHKATTFVIDIWSPAPQIPPADPGTTALVKGVQKMGIQMDRMSGGHGGVGDLAKTVQ